MGLYTGGLIFGMVSVSKLVGLYMGGLYSRGLYSNIYGIANPQLGSGLGLGLGSG